MTRPFEGIQIDLVKLSPNWRAIMRAQLREFIEIVDNCERAQGLNRLMALVMDARRYPRMKHRKAA